MPFVSRTSAHTCLYGRKDNKGIKYGWVVSPCFTSSAPVPDPALSLRADCKVAQQRERLPLHLHIFVVVDEGDSEVSARCMQQDIIDNYRSFPTVSESLR